VVRSFQTYARLWLGPRFIRTYVIYICSLNVTSRLSLTGESAVLYIHLQRDCGQVLPWSQEARNDLIIRGLPANLN
jgi:hypothetical protein